MRPQHFRDYGLSEITHSCPYSLLTIYGAGLSNLPNALADQLKCCFISAFDTLNVVTTSHNNYVADKRQHQLNNG